jgi:hypothetical protein
VDLGRNACRICGQGGFYPGEETAGVNGTGQGQVQFQLDATSHNDTYLNTSLPFPNPDAVQEFNLQSSNFTAEYGNAAGGIVNVVVKGGTNDIHGTLFHFLRNGALNARQFFAPEQDTLKRNQFGGSIGGPIVRTSCSTLGPSRERGSAPRQPGWCSSCRRRSSAPATSLQFPRAWWTR